MSILKNPIILAIIAFGVVFAAMYYWYNHFDTTKKRSNNPNKKKVKKEGINETTMISATIAGLLTWYIASSMFSEKSDENNAENNADNLKTKQESFESVNANITNFNNTGTANNLNNALNVSNNASVNANVNNVGNKQMGGRENKVPTIDANDPTRSYNLIGSGLNIPRSELKIPNVLIDYR